MATKNVTVIFDRKGNLLKKGTGKVEIRVYLSATVRKYIVVGETTKKGWKSYENSKELKAQCEKYEEIVRAMRFLGEDMTIENFNYHVYGEQAKKATEDPLDQSFLDFIRQELKKETLREGTLRHKIGSSDKCVFFLMHS